MLPASNLYTTPLHSKHKSNISSFDWSGFVDDDIADELKPISLMQSPRIRKVRGRPSELDRSYNNAGIHDPDFLAKSNRYPRFNANPHASHDRTPNSIRPRLIPTHFKSAHPSPLLLRVQQKARKPLLKPINLSMESPRT